MKTITIPMLRLGVDPILAGRLSGKRAFVAALEQFPDLSEPALVLLDFNGVDLATSSYLSEVLVPLRDHLRLRRYPGCAARAMRSSAAPPTHRDRSRTCSFAASSTTSFRKHFALSAVSAKPPLRS